MPVGIQLAPGGRAQLDVQHAADLCDLYCRPGVPVAQAPGRRAGDRAAQYRQGLGAVRLPRPERFLSQRDPPQLPLAHERAVLPGRRVAQRGLPAAGPGQRPGAAEGAQDRGRHARQHLQRHAAGRRDGPDRIHARVRADFRLTRIPAGGRAHARHGMPARAGSFLAAAPGGPSD
ncbi:p-protein (fragment) [Cupriavidus taiwanensis]